jgi:hypothetical protein
MSSRLQKIHILLIALLSSVFVLIASWSGYAATSQNIIKRIEWTMWTSWTTWSSNGNAGELTLISDPQGVYLDPTGGTNILSGNLWIENVGWAHLFPTTIYPPTTNIIDPWTLENNPGTFAGFIWSENAGWISLAAGNSTYSWVHYLPLEQSFTGYAWSDTLGYIDFGPTSAGLSRWLIGRVKILGNVGGNSFYTDIALLSEDNVSFNADKFTPFINQVKKNIALMMRNVTTLSLAQGINISNTTYKKTGNAILYANIPGNAIVSSSVFDGEFNDIPANTAETVTIVWSDLFINADIPNNTYLKKARAIIVLKDSSGNGWNIYIGDDVKNIYSSLIAEWSIYSGTWPANLYNNTKAKVTNLPANQLYIRGILVSRNTIGWSTTNTISSGACPLALAVVCTRDTAIQYDLSYFRNHDGIATRSSDKIGLDSNGIPYSAYSLIIDYDTRLVSDPPLGIRTQ